MNTDRWTRLKEVFGGALAQPPDARSAWVRQACGGDADLLREADALLRAHETVGDFLEQPAEFDGADFDTLAEGTTLCSYRIIREVGRGGMGVVYHAYDTHLERDVALKMLPPAMAANTQLRERQRREALAAARINDEHVAPVYALAEIDGHVVMVSEYVAGETLRAVLNRGGVGSGRAQEIAMAVAVALTAAHQAGVVHRDLKPENIIVTPNGLIKVIDFGIAHIESPGTDRLTKPGFPLGTPAYMAPEQMKGGAVTPRADVYSFGVVFRELLTGRHPLARQDEAAIPPRFAGIIERCVKVNPHDRYASGRELVAALTNDTVKPAASHERTVVGSPRWWWEFHQAAAAAVYWLMMWPAWTGRQIVGGPVGRGLFIATLIAVIVAANLRLHLWFTSRFTPTELRRARRRDGRWIRAADWLFVTSLAVMGILVGEDRSPVAIVLLAVAVGATIAFLVIERATARAAFRNSTTPRSGRAL